MNNLTKVIDALIQLVNKNGNNYRSKNYYANMRNKLNAVEHCYYYCGSVEYIYVLTFIDAAPCIHIGVRDDKEFMFPNTFTHEGVTYNVKITKPVA